MSSKTPVFFAFALWSLLCSWWYVCQIKQVCGKKELTQIAPPTAPEPIETPSVAATETAAPEKTEPAPEPARPQESTVQTERVEVVETGEDAVIHFPYNSTQKEADAAIDDYLSRLADQIRNSGKSVTIAGHTDGIGDASTNFAFAERRAKNIRDILIEKGVSRSQITTKSFGESKPIASNDTPEGRYKNRRVEITVGN